MYTSINLNIIYTDFCEKENKTQCAADKISNFISIVYKVTKRRFVNACVSVNKILAMTRIRKMVILKVGKCDKA